MTTFLTRISNRLFRRSRQLAARTIDDAVFYGTQKAPSLYRSRYDYSRERALAECLRAWRTNPVARSIVRTTSAFIVGKGITVSSSHRRTDRFIAQWWNHPLNRIGQQLRRWKDEDTRSGNLFFLFSVDTNTGMSYLRAVPAEGIEEIQTESNDIEQPTCYVRREAGESPWQAYRPAEEQAAFMLHFASNQPVGTPWGEPDLAPMLPWIGRLSSLLEDRARLNRFRNAFIYVVRGKYANVNEKQRRQAEINSTPPQPGNVLVVDEDEEWSVINPQLDSSDANTDILAIKKFIAAGVNFPLHWLAEPESSTRTTAEAAGTPSFRNLEAMQADFYQMLERLIRTALEVRRRYDPAIRPEARIEIHGPDITERDNSSLALAVNRVYPAIADLYERGIIDAQELARLTYRMAAETIDPDKLGEGERGRKAAGGKPRAEADPGEGREE